MKATYLSSFFPFPIRRRRHPSDFIFKQMLPLGHANEVKVRGGRGREGESTLASNISPLQRSPAEDFYLELMSFPKREIDFGLFRFETLAMTALRREKAGTAQCVLAPISPLLYVTVSLSSSVPAPLSPPAHSLLHYLLLDAPPLCRIR